MGLQVIKLTANVERKDLILHMLQAILIISVKNVENERKGKELGCISSCETYHQGDPKFPEELSTCTSNAPV